MQEMKKKKRKEQHGWNGYKIAVRATAQKRLNENGREQTYKKSRCEQEYCNFIALL